ncbi:MAG: PEP-CTERM sorting domain-containing protein [Planctomycetota bacterium]|nr:PEP-CTERM sorting domain-containing protein [Planctomycetota bacterium]
MVQRLTLAVVCVALLTLVVVPVGGEEVVLSEAPAYRWTHGCSPTTGIIIMGYWDAFGYSDLIPGSNSWSSNQAVIKNAIASPEHVADYALYDDVNDAGDPFPYTDKSELGGAHTNNCMADFMRTSFSSEGLTYASTWTSKIALGIQSYTSWRGYSFTAGGNYSSTPTIDDFKHEILMGRPVKFSVDSDGDGETDHSVAAIGFRYTNGYWEYACRDTWSTSSTPRWERFRPASSSYSWGINGWNSFRPAGTFRDTMWTSAGGDWDDAGWSTGTPNQLSYASITDNASITISSNAKAKYVMNRGNMDIQSGTLTVGTLASAGAVNQSGGAVNAADTVAIGKNGIYTLSGGVLEVNSELDVSGQFNLASASADVVVENRLSFETGSTFTSVPDATIHMTGASFGNESTSSSDLTGLRNLTLIFEGGSEDFDPFESAGEDMGAVVAGFDNNFALGTLQLGGVDIGQIQLVDNFDNQSGWVGSEALYVANLILGAGSTLDLNGLNLYYYTGEISGTVLEEGGALAPIEWIKGDANWDIKVEGSDLNLLLTGWGTGTQWDEGDFNGDGVVDGSDLNFLLTNWTYPPASASAVPEPASAMLLLSGGVLVLFRRGRK